MWFTDHSSSANDQAIHQKAVCHGHGKQHATPIMVIIMIIMVIIMIIMVINIVIIAVMVLIIQVVTVVTMLVIGKLTLWDFGLPPLPQLSKKFKNEKNAHFCWKLTL